MSSGMRLLLLIAGIVIMAVCVTAQITPRTAVVQGQLLKSNGRPLAYTELELVPLSSQHIINDSHLIAVSSLSGKFSFLDVPAGKYTLSINFDDKPTDLSPYETYFYPNVVERSLAKTFEIEANTLIRGLIFRLPPTLVQKRIMGRVVWEDGSPVVGAWIGFRDVKFDRSVSFGKPETDSNGRFSVIGFVGRQYQFGAVLFERKPEFFESRPGLPPDPPADLLGGGESDIFKAEPAMGVVEFRIQKSAEARHLLDGYVAMIDEIDLTNASF
jgi:hypothetical protein